MALSQRGKSISRRSFLRLSAVTGAAGALWLSACGGSTSSSTAPGSPSAGGSASAAPAKLPAYVPFQGVKPDLPPTADGVDPGFFGFPKTLVKSVPQPPGDGSDVTVVTWLSQSAPAPVDSNAAWQALNKGMNINLKATLAPSVDYPQRLATVIAGNDLPDLIFGGSPGISLSDAPAFLKAKCADLTPYLSGDAIKDYPNLAAIPTLSWKGCLFDGALYAVPVPRPPFNLSMITRKDLFDQTGLPYPKTAADLKKVLQAINKPPDHWAAGANSGMSFNLQPGSHLLAAFGAPNSWKVEGGKLTKDYETDEFKAAVSYVKELYTAGLFHPDSNLMSVAQANANFANGKYAWYISSWFAYELKWQALSSPQGNAVANGKIEMMDPFTWDGKGQPTYFFGPGAFGYTFIKQSTPQRVKMLLGVLNFLAAPVGTEEWALHSYGVKGVDYNLDDNGNPKLTTKGTADMTDAPFWHYLAANPPALIETIYPKDWATTVQKHEEVLAKAGTVDPTLGLYSKTFGSKGSVFNGNFQSGITDIIAGRRPMTDYDQLVKDWRSQGGETSRTEYQQSLAAAAKA